MVGNKKYFTAVVKNTAGYKRLDEDQFYILPDHRVYRLVSVKSLLGPDSLAKGFRMMEVDKTEAFWSSEEQQKVHRRSKAAGSSMVATRPRKRVNTLMDMPKEEVLFQRDSSQSEKEEEEITRPRKPMKLPRKKTAETNKRSKKNDLKKFSALCLQLAEASLTEWRKRS